MLRHAFVGALALLAPIATASARDHREADFVAENPKIDGTDFYMFRSFEEGREDFVVLVACYQPLQVPFAGPHGYTMDPDAVYAIHVDNDGDGFEDVTFQFRFALHMRDADVAVGSPREKLMVSRPVMSGEPVLPHDVRAPELAVYETYEVDVVLRDGAGTTVVPLRRTGTDCTVFRKAPDYRGNATFPDYAELAAQHVMDVVYPGGWEGRLFVGPRREPSALGMGDLFDLLSGDLVGAPDAVQNRLEQFNVTALALEVPVPVLHGVNRVLGAWTTASLPSARAMRGAPVFDGVDDEYGRPMQVSRVGMPLVSSLLIGVDDKDAFNGAHPADDARFLPYFTHPVLPELVEDLRGFRAPDYFPRTDLVQFFLRGIPGLTETRATAAILRLCYDVEPCTARGQSPLGLLGGDPAGYPNGRRPGDDVADITLRVLMGANLHETVAPSARLPFTDGVAISGHGCPREFPFLHSPNPGALH